MINFYFSDEYVNHDTGSHPESIQRIKTVKQLLNNKYTKHHFIEPSIASTELISNVHDKQYIEEILMNIPKSGFYHFDPDTIASSTSLNSYLMAVGGSVDSVIHSINHQSKNPVYFCAHRPPGHHAEKNKAMGFGVFNNVAIAAQFALEQKNYNKILIIDFDVHHGNGTQDIFYNDKNVLYISTHQYPYYPGSGSEKENGKYNNVLNIPLEAGTTGNEYLNAYEKVLDKLKEFKPEFLLFSAGFDAHIDDPLAQLRLSSEDFYKITKRTLEVSKPFCNGNIVSILEGGYDLRALQESTQRHVDALIEFN